MNKFHKLLVLFTVIVLAGTILSCNFDETEKKTIVSGQYYIIEPATLLDSIKQQKENIFSSVDEQPIHVSPDQQVPVNWSQTDYLYIANAVHTLTWGESLDSWQLHTMDFRLDCANIESGFQNGRFEFFKVIKKGDRESRITHSIDIDPRSKFVYATEAEYYPKLVDWKPIDLGQAKISADDFLQIAEDNGGQDKRVSIGNACDISVGLSPDIARYKGWTASYTQSENSERLFVISVDPLTGEIHIP